MILSQSRATGLVHVHACAFCILGQDSSVNVALPFIFRSGEVCI